MCWTREYYIHYSHASYQTTSSINHKHENAWRGLSNDGDDDDAPMVCLAVCLHQVVCMCWVQLHFVSPRDPEIASRRKMEYCFVNHVHAPVYSHNKHCTYTVKPVSGGNLSTAEIVQFLSNTQITCLRRNKKFTFPSSVLSRIIYYFVHSEYYPIFFIKHT